MFKKPFLQNIWNIIIGNTTTSAVYVFATPNIEITANEYPRKFDPVSPINVFAGFKLYGKNPTNAPISDVIKIIETTGDPLNANTISIETHEIIDIPDDNPSNPSIKLIAFVIPTIQPIVTIVETVCKKFVESPNL